MLDHATYCQILGQLYLDSVLRNREALAASQKTLEELQKNLREKESLLAEAYRQQDVLRDNLRTAEEELASLKNPAE